MKDLWFGEVEMTYTPVTWSSGDLVTSAKLGQMADNDAYFYERPDQLLFCEEEINSTTSATYISLMLCRVYLPHGDRGSITAYWQMRDTNSGTSYIKIVFDTLESAETTETSGGWTDKSVALDVSSLTAGNPYSLDIQGKAAGGGTCNLRGISVIVSPE